MNISSRMMFTAVIYNSAKFVVALITYFNTNNCYFPILCTIPGERFQHVDNCYFPTVCTIPGERFQHVDNCISLLCVPFPGERFQHVDNCISLLCVPFQVSVSSTWTTVFPYFVYHSRWAFPARGQLYFPTVCTIPGERFQHVDNCISLLCVPFQVSVSSTWTTVFPYFVYHSRWAFPARGQLLFPYFVYHSRWAFPARGQLCFPTLCTIPGERFQHVDNCVSLLCVLFQVSVSSTWTTVISLLCVPFQVSVSSTWTTVFPYCVYYSRWAFPARGQLLFPYFVYHSRWAFPARGQLCFPTLCTIPGERFQHVDNCVSLLCVPFQVSVSSTWTTVISLLCVPFQVSVSSTWTTVFPYFVYHSRWAFPARGQLCFPTLCTIPGERFQHVDNCVEYTCTCRCDGSYDCPGSSGRRVCRGGSGSGGRFVSMGSSRWDQQINTNKSI